VVSIIILNYNTFQLTCNCIQSVTDHVSIAHEIILVDNASTECDPELFSAKFPFIKLVKNPLNNGFAKGNNLGIENANGTIILLLNSDTFLTTDAVTPAAEYLLAHEETGVLGCRMIYPDGSVQHTARRFRSISWELMDLFRLVLYLLPYKKRAQRMLGKYFKGDFDTTCDWLNGAFFMFRKEILLKLPAEKLDDRFFMYGEDHLWCWQIKQLGYENYFYSAATIVHISSGSTSMEKQLNLRRTMMQHELDIMKIRKGKGVYYSLFAFIYTGKEKFRNTVKQVVYQLTGKLLR
jgi:GT2 family glycosyltransferase